MKTGGIKLNTIFQTRLNRHQRCRIVLVNSDKKDEKETSLLLPK